MKRISVGELRFALIFSVAAVIGLLAAHDYLLAAMVTAVIVIGTAWQVRHGTNPISRVAKYDDDDGTNRDE